MLLSVSRRTDIPNYYSEWFFNRIKEGFVYVRNPMNVHQISKIDISPDVVDCIVFWTKNPEPMINRLDELAAYQYCFQFTLTGYGKDMECNVPNKKDKMIPVFQELSEKIGKQKVIWRYDPIIFTKKYTPEYHLKAFEQIAASLKGYTEKCVISFVDTYVKNKRNMELIAAYEMGKSELWEFAKKISEIARRNGMSVGSCAESIDLEACGIEHNCCIDKTLIERIIGCRLKVGKDKNQRKECGCMESVEIGTYDTCKNGCKYCYANHSGESVAKNCSKYDPESPILCGVIDEKDQITERKVKSLKEQQLSFVDMKRRIGRVKLLFGTGNPAKLDVMRRRLSSLGIELIGLNDIDTELPDIAEDGKTPLENARKKAMGYYKAFHIPVFSCDSGLYIDGIPEEDQPGVHVRTIGGKYLSDEEMIEHYTALARKYGNLTARYKNAICLVMEDNKIYEAMDADMESDPFVITSVPHSIRKKGFPLDSISLDIRTGKYYYDLTESELDQVAVEDGFLRFFRECLAVSQV